MVKGILILNTGSNASISNPIWLNGVTRITPAWKRLIQTPPNNSLNLQQVFQDGFENPVFSIEGIIDMENTSGTYTINGRANCVKVTPELLRQLINLTQTADSQLVMEVYWGDFPFPSLTSSSNIFNIAIESINFDLTADTVSEEGNFNNLWRYNISIREVRSL